ncbi:hypothetical protein GCM10028796_45740 [Ramlibacter monticola]|uniref:Gas vesicle protein K n=1 Tax=Ramlibacter monticola TaxID=1926872 RepID=A0A937CUD6_9BURK|nr:gas vesicle protein K [Ramlibacter monticola]MBL0393256.1 gas vesicle protein K [Ramlibacter monticola]
MPRARPGEGGTRAPRKKAASLRERTVGGLTVAEIGELELLRSEIERSSRRGEPARWDANPEDVQRSVLRLVLTLVEFIRRLLERQAIRRMEAGTLTDSETEDIGRALMLLEATVRDLTEKFGLQAEDLNLDLGPLGKMM